MPELWYSFSCNKLHTDYASIRYKYVKVINRFSNWVNIGEPIFRETINKYKELNTRFSISGI